LKKETDSASKDRLERLNPELAELEDKSASLNWHAAGRTWSEPRVSCRRTTALLLLEQRKEG
jgi:hypothetical protein